MKSIFKVLKTFIYFLLVIVLFFNISSIVQKTVIKQDFPMSFGIGYCIVGSGSMEPTLKWGDFIVVKKKDHYKIDDIITFKQNGDSLPTTHRIVAFPTDKEKVITKGDANNVSDDPIDKNQIYGKVVFKIPLIGYLLVFLKNKIVICVLITIIFISLYLDFIPKKKG